MMLNEVLIGGGARLCRFLGRLCRPLRSSGYTLLDLSTGPIDWPVGVVFEGIREGLKVFYRGLGAGCRTELLDVVQNGEQLSYCHRAATPCLKHLVEYHLRCLLPISQRRDYWEQAWQKQRQS